MENGPGAEALGVSRETYARLEQFVDLLLKWTRRINLISRNDQSVVWSRHLADSIQVFRAAPATAHWVDLGSGGGFPGAVAAILAMEEAPDTRFTLIESDLRKATFLRTAARECAVPMTVVNQRIETAPPQNAGLVSARALADLDTLLDYAQRHGAEGGTFLFSKGKSWGKEVEDARRRWKFDLEARRSETDPDGALLIIKGVSRD